MKSTFTENNCTLPKKVPFTESTFFIKYTYFKKDFLEYNNRFILCFL